MDIENTLRTFKVKMFYGVMLGVLSALIVYFFLEPNRESIKILLLSVISLLVLTYLFMLIIRLNFFLISAQKDKLVIRFYTAHPFFRKYKAFEIPKSAFYDFKIKRQVFGLKKDILFIAKTPKGEFSFPPISISLLDKEKIRKLEFLLNDLKLKK